MKQDELLKFQQAKGYLDFVDTWEKIGVLTQEHKDKRGKAKLVCKELSPLFDIDLITPPTDLFDI